MSNRETLEQGSFNEIRVMLYEQAGEPGQWYWELLMDGLEEAFRRGESVGNRIRRRNLRKRAQRLRWPG
jgi:hypothetical protein